MNEILKKDITIRIISVLTAIIFWIYVYNVDVNPYTTKTVTVPIKSTNSSALIDKDIKLDNTLPGSIEVKVSGRKKALEKLKESDIKAVVDFGKINSVEDKTLTIDVTSNNKAVTLENKGTGYSVDLSLSRYKSNYFPIEIIPNITFKQGYKKLKITVVPDSVKLEEEEAIVDSVDAVKATLDLKNIDRDTTKRVECKVYNKEGKDITRYFEKTITADVKVEVAKEVPVTLVVNGTPANDYIESTRSVNPKTVLITGTPEVLAKITDLKTEPVSIANLMQSIDVTGSVKLPEGVKLAEVENTFAINVQIERLETKTYEILKNDIFIRNEDINSGLSYTIKNDSVSISVKGLLSDISLLRTESMNLSVDVQGLVEGTHRLPLNISLPESVKLLDKVFVDVVIKKPEVAISTQ